MPLVVVKHREAAGRRRRSTDDVHHDVDPSELISYCIGDGAAAVNRGDVRGDEVQVFRKAMRRSSGRAQDRRAFIAQTRRDRVPDAFAGAGDQRARAAQLAAHQRISSDAICPPSSLNACWSSTGLPGKSPATLARTTITPSLSVTLNGTTVW